MPRLEVGGNARAAEAHRVVSDDQLVRAGGGDVPRLQRHPVVGGKADVLEFEAVLGRRVQDGRAPQVAEPISEALQSLIDLHFRGIDFVLNVGHRPFLFLCLFHPCDARLATCRCQRATHLFP